MVILIAILAALLAASGQPDAQAIIDRSVQANNADWKAAPDYDYFETDRTNGTKTYQVRMILGSPYERLMAIAGRPLPPVDQKKEDVKLQAALRQRQGESERERADRISNYEHQRKRDRLLMEQLTAAFNFRLVGRQKLNPYEVYVLQATPRPGYQPPSMEAEVLTGMQGRLWIDTRTFQWVKVEAKVIHPVSIGGFLARVEPGTRFELEKMPVAEGVWLPKHFSMQSHARILFFFSHEDQDDETYFDYHRTAPNGGR